MDYKSFNEFDRRDFDALDLALRAAGARPVNLSDLHPVSDDWDKLHQTRSAVVKGAKALLESIKDGSDENEIRKASAAHDCLMASIDVIDGEMDRRKALGQREPLTLAQRGVPVMGAESIWCGEGSEPARRDSWSDRKGNEIRVLAPNQPILEGRAEGLGVGDIARMMIFGPRSDVERRALAEGTDSAGG